MSSISSLQNADFTMAFTPTPPPPPAPPGPPPTDQPFPNWSFAHLQFPFGSYMIWTRYLWVNGVLQEPVMAQATGTLIPCDVISYCSPYGRKEVIWVATRAGQPPPKPDPNPIDPNLVLEWFTYTPKATMLQASLTHNFEHRGHYSYICLTPIPPSSGYSYGAPSYDNTPLASCVSDSTEFVQGII